MSLNVQKIFVKCLYLATVNCACLIKNLEQTFHIYQGLHRDEEETGCDIMMYRGLNSNQFPVLSKMAHIYLALLLTQ